MTVTCAIQTPLIETLSKPSITWLIFFWGGREKIASPDSVNRMYRHGKNMGTINGTMFGGTVHNIYGSARVSENMWLFGCMRFLCGRTQIEKLQFDHLKVSDESGGWGRIIKEDQGWLRKYNITTERSSNCRNRLCHLWCVCKWGDQK